MPAPLAALIGRGIAAFGSRAAAGEAVSMSASSMVPAAGGGAGGGAAANILKVAQAFGALNQVVGQAMAPIGAFKDGLQSLSQHFSGAVDTFTMLSDVIGGLGNKIAPFVAAANPGKVEQFSLAMKDFHAVLGKALMPAMESFTRIARKVGDVFAKLEPIFRDFFTQVGGFFEDVFEGIASALKANAPLIDFTLKAIGSSLRFFGKVLKGVFEFVGQVMSVIGRFVGLNALGFGKMNENASAQGAAVRSISIGGSGDDLYKRASETAFMQGTPEDKTVSTLTSIYTYLTKELTPAKLGMALGKAIAEILQQAAPTKEAVAEEALSHPLSPEGYILERVFRDLVYGH